MTARKAAHSLQRDNGALASGFATVQLHHAPGHDPDETPCALKQPCFHRKAPFRPCLFPRLALQCFRSSWLSTPFT
jgi:hypothetical protein